MRQRRADQRRNDHTGEHLLFSRARTHTHMHAQSVRQAAGSVDRYTHTGQIDDCKMRTVKITMNRTKKEEKKIVCLDFLYCDFYMISRLRYIFVPMPRARAHSQRIFFFILLFLFVFFVAFICFVLVFFFFSPPAYLYIYYYYLYSCSCVCCCTFFPFALATKESNNNNISEIYSALFRDKQSTRQRRREQIIKKKNARSRSHTQQILLYANYSAARFFFSCLLWIDLYKIYDL